MASAFTHAFAAVGIGHVAKLWPVIQNEAKQVDWKFWALGMVCASFPDIDAIGFFAGVPYDSFWGHRGFTHSFFFAFLLAVAVMFLFYSHEKTGSKKWWALLLLFFVATASHSILDAMTTGGRGVAFFSPFENSRYFFPFRPIKVSPIGVTRFFSQKGINVLKSEFIWVWIPTLTVIILCWVAKKLFAKRGFV